MSDQVQRNVVSFDDDNILQESANYFKGQKDQKYRIRIPNINQILMYRQHYDKTAGFMRCLQDRGEECPVCKLVDDPITRFKANILVYNTTTSDGTLPEDLNYVSVVPMVFRFGIKMFAALKAKHKKFAKQGGLGSIDLILTCTNEAYQHFDVEDDATCASLEDARLKKMADKLIKDKFIDFENFRDRNLKFLSPLKEREYIAKVTGVAPASPAPQEPTDDNPDLDEAEKTLMGDKDEDKASVQSVKDLI